MANALIMMKMTHTVRNELNDIAPAFFEKYKDYLLGDYVYGLRASDDYGGMIPPWTGPWSLATSTQFESTATRSWRSRACLSSER